MLVHWIWLATRPAVSDRMKVVLLRAFQDPETLYFSDSSSYEQVEGLSEEARASLGDKELSHAEKILNQCSREGLHILTYQDAAYPRRLQNIPDPPLVLYYKGSLPDFEGVPMIGVVGTRKASPYGLTAAKRMGYQIARCGGTVVSGMAYGIDGMSMQGALTAGGAAVGVLGCGADVVYPVANRPLFRDMERYGCILSEFVPGTPPYPQNFPKRNRIISGLCNGVLVVEAPEKSGALITANLAAEQGRDVFVVPGNIDVPTFIGSNRLLREGAIAVSHGWDILSEYEAMYPDKIRKETAVSHQTGYIDEVRDSQGQENTRPKVAEKPRILRKNPLPEANADKKVIDKAVSSSYSDVNDKLSRLNPQQRQIVATLERGERLVDDVIAETGLNAGKVLAELTLLEVMGVVKRHPGRRISL